MIRSFAILRNTALILSMCVLSQTAVAESSPGARNVRVIGRKAITITTPEVRLGDLANVSSRLVRDDDIVIGLKKIFIARSPAPGRTVTISASQVLERMSEEGVATGQLGYSLPRIMKITRASRQLTSEEIMMTIEEALQKQEGELEIKGLDYSEPVHVLPGSVTLKVNGFSRPRPGKLKFSMNAMVEGESPQRFAVEATVEEWAEVPVARRPLLKGSVVGAQDVVMARMNMSQIPSDAAFSPNRIIGMETSRSITYGEVFRKNKLSIPPLIESGARVTLIYETRLLKATASGIALEAGAAGQVIRVKNEASRKIITGTVEESGLVKVQP